MVEMRGVGVGSEPTAFGDGRKGPSSWRLHRPVAAHDPLHPFAGMTSFGPPEQLQGQHVIAVGKHAVAPMRDPEVIGPAHDDGSELYEQLPL